MCAPTPNPSSASSGHNDDSQQQTIGCCCCESVGSKIDRGIHGFFFGLGDKLVATRPWTTIACSILLAALCGGGLARFSTENRGEELWVPQETIAESEEASYLSYYPRTARFQQIILEDKTNGDNMLTKINLLAALQLHEEIAGTVATVDGVSYTLPDLCVRSGGACASGPIPSNPASCVCLLQGILRQWNYDPAAVANQTSEEILEAARAFGSREDLESVLGSPTFDENDQLLSAEAITVSYFLADRSVTEDGTVTDPINEAWEETAFLDSVQSVEGDDGRPVNGTYSTLTASYLSGRSFADEFGGAITGDLALVQVSYVVTFLFLGATLGRIRCGQGSRWSMSIAALFMIGLSTLAGFGVASAIGLFFGPVHSLLPFVLLGIGVDDAFVIVNAFNQERKGISRQAESDEALVKRGATALARAGASITVTSLTDLVAFAISSSSALPALASFCAYASICITFLWIFAATFFTAALVIDEKRQKAGKWDCLCCFGGGGKKSGDDDDDGDAPAAVDDNQDGLASRYFRNYHSRAILSVPGKIVVLLVFAGLLGFGIFGALNLSVEDSERNFIPAGSYINDFVDKSDEFFPSSGIDLNIIFENVVDGSSVYDSRVELSQLDQRLTGLSTDEPYIAEPNSEDTYQNVMAGLSAYLQAEGSAASIGGAALGDDGWPTTQEDFETTLKNYTDFSSPGARYAQDVSFDGTSLRAFRVRLEYVRLTKENRGEVIDDANRQIEAMDATRDLIDGWTDLPPAFPYSPKFLSIEGFKIIRQELFQNVGLAILAVAIIVLATVGNVVTALLITMNVAFCITEILGFMYAAGIVIDSVSVINIVLAVGLSVDYSAHVGHCFMTKAGDRNSRTTEALSDIGAAVLNGATSTFLAVAVLLGSSSYVFATLSTQFALTVGLGVVHGLVLLPVLLSLLGPRPFASAALEGHHQEEQQQQQQQQGQRKEVVERDDSDDQAAEATA